MRQSNLTPDLSAYKMLKRFLRHGALASPNQLLCFIWFASQATCLSLFLTPPRTECQIHVRTYIITHCPLYAGNAYLACIHKHTHMDLLSSSVYCFASKLLNVIDWLRNLACAKLFSMMARGLCVSLLCVCIMPFYLSKAMRLLCIIMCIYVCLCSAQAASMWSCLLMLDFNQ